MKSILVFQFVDKEGEVRPLAVVGGNIRANFEAQLLNDLNWRIERDHQCCWFPPANLLRYRFKWKCHREFYMDLLRRRLCTSFALAKRPLGAMISCPSTRRNVVENRPNSLTNSDWGRINCMLVIIDNLSVPGHQSWQDLQRQRRALRRWKWAKDGL